MPQRRPRARTIARTTLAILAGILPPHATLAADWPQWGRTPSRNMTSPEKNLPASFDPGQPKDDGETIDPATTRNVKWVARLGSQSYGNVTVGNGKVLLGTNNDPGKDEKHQGDRGVVLCLDEKTGNVLWQLVVPKLPAGNVSDFEGVGICSSPTIDGDRVYLVTNRCEVVCLDLNGPANGNDGPFKDEAKYMTPAGQDLVEPGATDADVIWRYDMRDELGVFPLNMTSSAVLVLGDRLYVTTSNSVDWTHKHIPNPNAPALICLDKKTGKLLAQEASGISSRTFDSNWSSPAYGEIDGKGMILFGGGDGWCYAFDPTPVKDASGADVLKELWRFDCNALVPKEVNGKPVTYGSPKGPNEIIATPVFHDGKVYVATGQNPENGDGDGALWCIDAGKTGDVTQSAKVWAYTKIGRSLSTVSVTDDGLLFVADLSGYLHCLDAKSGEPHWTHDLEGKAWGSAVVADGKAYVGNESGDLFVFPAGKEKKDPTKISLNSPMFSSPVIANGVLYVGTERYLYAVGGRKP